MLGHEPFELGHELGIEAAREVGLHPVLERRDAPILQVAGRSGSEWLGQHVRQRRPVPQRERVARLSCGAQLLEALEVKLARLDPDRVSGRAPHDRFPVGANARRSDDTCASSAWSTRGGGVSPHSPSINLSRDTGSPAPSSSRRNPRCLGPRRGSGRPSCTTSTGPRSRNSVTSRP